MIFVTSDLHGYPLKKFQKLLNKAGFTDKDSLFVLGDVIDRNGDGGIEALLWIMEQPNVRMLLGNHEAMMLACGFLFDEVTEISVGELDSNQMNQLLNWMYNGAQATIDSLYKLRKNDPDKLWELLDFVAELPLYERVSTDSGDYLLVHGGMENFDPERSMDSYSAHEIVWHRPRADEKFFSDVTTIIGHTPTQYYGNPKGKMFATETWIDIDTGAASGGNPMVLRLDDLKPFYY